MSKKIVLVVEGNKEVQEMLQTKLLHLGYEVEFVMGEEAAVTILEKGHFDLVIANVDRMFGNFRTLLRMAKRCNIPVLVTTIDPRPGFLDVLKEAGAVEAFLEPVYPPKRFNEAVRRLMG